VKFCAACSCAGLVRTKAPRLNMASETQNKFRSERKLSPYIP
jgi:hypothetical protein